MACGKAVGVRAAETKVDMEGGWGWNGGAAVTES